MNDRVVVTRLFTELSHQTTARICPPLPLDAFTDKDALVVVGDPGSGKTTSFKQAADREPNGLFVSLRRFLRASDHTQFRGMILFIDALDEVRAKAPDGSAVLDNLIRRLEELDRPKFRLSCRASDWYGGLDESHLTDAAANRQVTVVRLEPLGEEEIGEIAKHHGADPVDFIDQAKQRSMFELLTNPQSLELMLKVVDAGKNWPRTRTELFDRACLKLAEERNPEHGRSRRGQLDSTSVIEAAGLLCAIHLCSGNAGFALTRPRADDSYPCIEDVAHDTSLLDAAARRKLFHSEEPERVAPTHRTVGEYLAARYLVGRVRAGLPIGRVLALVTGFDGGTLSDLRGLFAWVACLCPEHAETLIARDPLGVVLYGDVAPLPPSCKLAVVKKFSELAEENPWFRSENWNPQPFGALLSNEMEPIFCEILDDPNQHPVLVWCVLDAITYGDPLPAFGDLLLSMIRDKDRTERLGVAALKAFCNVSPERIDDLLQLLDGIHAGRVPDEHQRLRGELLRILYPRVIGPSQVLKYLVAENRRYFGRYHTFISQGLLDATEAADLPILLDGIVGSGYSTTQEARQPDRSQFNDFIGRLLVQALSLYGESVDVDRLCRWLGASLDRYDHPLIETNDGKTIKAYFESHSRIVRRLFKYWLSLTSSQNPRYAMIKFWRRLYLPKPPRYFAHWLLALAAREQRDEFAGCLFREAVQFLTLQNRADAPNVEQLFDYVNQYPHFADTLLADQDTDSELYWLIPDWRRDDAERRANERKRRQDIQRANSTLWMGHLAEIRAGTALGLLQHFAKVYFAMFLDIDRNTAPRARLLEIMNDTVAGAALEGFAAVLSRTDLPSPREIGHTTARGRTHYIAHPVLAGIDIVAERSMSELLDLANRTLQSVLCFHYATSVDDEHGWVSHLVAKRPDVAASAMKAFWEGQLARRDTSHIEGLYQLAHDSKMAVLAQQVTIPLLRHHANCAVKFLEDLLQAAMHHASHPELLKLARRTLGRSGAVKGARRVLWFAVVLLLAPTEFGDKATRYVRKSKEKAARLLGFVVSPHSETGSLYTSTQLDALACLIHIIAPVFPPRSDKDGFLTEHSRAVRDLIEQIGNDATPQASKVLDKLRSDPDMRPHWEALAHVAAIQSRNRREKEFRYPTLLEVTETLKDGRPANPADLLVLVSSHLRTLASAIRNGPTNMYRTFWNIEAGKLATPIPENDARDRLLAHLQPLLRPLGVAPEREGNYVANSRADIKVIYHDKNLPVEIKRHYHKNLWTAPKDQLLEKYMRDPGAGGFGIYLVLWFGEAPGRRVPKPPNNMDRPTSARTLETALTKVIPRDHCNSIAVICIDCSPPAGELARPKPRAAKKRNVPPKK